MKMNSTFAGTAAKTGTAAALAVLSLWLMIPCSGFASLGQEPLSVSLQKAYGVLQEGVNTWDPLKLSQARDLFLGLLLEHKEPAALLAMSVGLADLRLATCHLTRSATAEAERFVSEGEIYLDRAMKADPKSGEAAALYGYMLGLDTALHLDQAQALGTRSFSALSQAVSLEPENPRVQLLYGEYLLYLPEEYGGGKELAIASLEKAAGLFEKENPGPSWKPDWGKDEAYTYLGLAYAKTDPVKARAFFEKALAVNPGMGLAKSELAKIAK